MSLLLLLVQYYNYNLFSYYASTKASLSPHAASERVSANNALRCFNFIMKIVLCRLLFILHCKYKSFIAV